jgi:ribosomal protein L40E
MRRQRDLLKDLCIRCETRHAERGTLCRDCMRATFSERSRKAWRSRRRVQAARERAEIAEVLSRMPKVDETYVWNDREWKR